MTDTIEKKIETVVDAVDATTGESTSEMFDKHIKLIEDTFKSLKNHITDLKKMKKEVSLLERRSKSGGRKKSGVKSDKQSGFKIPTPISDELCDFLKMPRGSLVARANVTKLLSDYIKENKLKDETNGRNFKFNDSPESKAFEKLLDISQLDGETPGYMILQKLIKHHFLKPELSEEDKAAAAAKKKKTKTVEKSEAATSDKSDEKPAEKPAEKTKPKETKKVSEKPVEKAAEKPAEKAKTDEKPSEKPKTEEPKKVVKKLIKKVAQ